MPSPVNVKVELCDILTAPVCSQLIVEFVKYIIYQRQQIPYPYKQLVSIITKKEAIDVKYAKEGEKSVAGLPTWKTVQVENEYRKVSGILETMQSTFKHLEEELATNSGVEEVVLVLGPTPMSPREVYRLQFPPLPFGHSASQHPHQRSLLQLLRSIISSERLHSLVSQPLAPTNLYLLLHKKRSTMVTSGFTLKERYYLPSSGKHIIIQFLPPQNLVPQCTCTKFAVFQDNLKASSDPGIESQKSEEVKENCGVSAVHEVDPEEQWYVAHGTVKGFKDLKVNGVSVTSIWLQSRSNQGV